MSDYNSTCIHCGGPCHMGMVNTDCPECGVNGERYKGPWKDRVGYAREMSGDDEGMIRCTHPDMPLWAIAPTNETALVELQKVAEGRAANQAACLEEHGWRWTAGPSTVGDIYAVVMPDGQRIEAKTAERIRTGDLCTIEDGAIVRVDV